MRPVRSWALSTPAALTDWAVFLSRLRMASGVARRKLRQDVPGDGEDGPVVDLQDVVPGGQRLSLGVVDAVAADHGQGLDLRVQPGDALVEDEGVGDDGAGHAAGLRHVAHAQQARDGRR